jgi:hypothetical protein
MTTSLRGLTIMTALAVSACGSTTGSSNPSSTTSAITLKMNHKQLSTSTSIAAKTNADSGIDPTSVSAKIYEIAVSTSAECTSLTSIYSATDPSYTAFTDNPDLGTGTLVNDTYKCIVIEMSDQIQFVPSHTSTTGNCVSGTTYTLDVCGQGNDSNTASLIDGTTTTCAASQDDRVAIWLSTLSTSLPKNPDNDEGNTGNPFAAATTARTIDGFALENAPVVSGATTMTFVADFTSRVADRNGICECESPNWGFE